MVRKQVYIQQEQEETLKRRARELGLTESELIRRGIDQISRSPLTLLTDRRAWEEAKVFIRQRLQMAAPQTGRRWTRDELYDERLQRFSS